MAKLTMRVIQVDGERVATIEVVFTNDVSKDAIIKSMKAMFEIEMITAQIITGKENTVIRIKSENEEKLAMVRKGIIKTFREGSGLGNINTN